MLTIVLGTARKGRESEKVAYLVRDEAKKHGYTIQFADVREYTTDHTIPSWEKDEKSKQWEKIAANTDAFIFVVPEYNHSFPGELKLLLDRLYKEYAGKTAAIVGVSSGGFGGVRMIEHLISSAGQFLHARGTTAAQCAQRREFV